MMVLFISLTNFGAVLWLTLLLFLCHVRSRGLSRGVIASVCSYTCTRAHSISGHVIFKKYSFMSNATHWSFSPSFSPETGNNHG